MGRKYFSLLRGLGVAAPALIFVSVTIGSEAIVRIADSLGLFKLDWMRSMIEAAIPMLQSPVAIAGAGILAGTLLGRYTLTKWPITYRIDQERLLAPARGKLLPLKLPHNNSSVPQELAGWQVSDRDDFDVIAHALVIRCTRNDSGFDVRGTIQYKNRSMAPLFLKNIGIIWSVDGKSPEGKKTGGISVPIPPDRTDSLSLLPIRVYGEKARSGEAAFIFKFGREQDNLRCALAIHYTFDIVKYPENKSVDAVVQENVNLTATYYLAPVD